MSKNVTYYSSEVKNENIPKKDRVYVQPDQIHINDNGIFVDIEGTFYQIAQICNDDVGFYIPYTAYWKYCPNGHPNPPWRWRCKVCKELL